MKKNKIIILTNSYPYGNAELSFLKNEIQHISTSFEEVIILPMNCTGEIDSLPSNVSISNILINNQFNSVKWNIESIPLFVNILFLDFIRNWPLLNFYKTLRYQISLLSQIYLKYKLLESFLVKTQADKIILYSFWFDEGATMGAIIKRNCKKKITFISRAHGFDLYEERNKNGYIPFRLFQLKYVDRLIAISKHGLNYLNDRFPAFKNKFGISYMGTTNYKNINTENKINEYLTIVSCSRLVKIKRVHLIAEALDLVKTKVHWIHFGDGEELEKVREKCKNFSENIKVEFRGNVSNSNILEFYSKNKVDVFINVSESEGLPVSLMEAISFGIPIIAPDVGGCSEIVTEATGLLFPSDFRSIELAEIIESYNSTKFVTKKFRNGVRLFWEQNFNVETTSKKFISKYLNQ